MDKWGPAHGGKPASSPFREKTGLESLDALQNMDGMDTDPSLMQKAINALENANASSGSRDERLLDRIFSHLQFFRSLPPELRHFCSRNFSLLATKPTKQDNGGSLLVFQQGTSMSKRPGLFVLLSGEVRLFELERADALDRFSSKNQIPMSLLSQLSPAKERENATTHINQEARLPSGFTSTSIVAYSNIPSTNGGIPEPHVGTHVLLPPMVPDDAGIQVTNPSELLQKRIKKDTDPKSLHDSAQKPTLTSMHVDVHTLQRTASHDSDIHTGHARSAVKHTSGQLPLHTSTINDHQMSNNTAYAQIPSSNHTITLSRPSSATASETHNTRVTPTSSKHTPASMVKSQNMAHNNNEMSHSASILDAKNMNKLGTCDTILLPGDAFGEDVLVHSCKTRTCSAVMVGLNGAACCIVIENREILDRIHEYMASKLSPTYWIR
jgi:hypothetical protein